MIFNAPRFARRSFGLLDEDGDGIYDSQRGGVGEDENIPYAPVVVSNSLMGIAVDGRESIGGGEGGGERDSFSRSLRGEGEGGVEVEGREGRQQADLRIELHQLRQSLLHLCKAKQVYKIVKIGRLALKLSIYERRRW